MTNKVVLIILDGWGYRQEKKGNAIALAKISHFNLFWQKYPHALLRASGEAVGLPEGQMGTSEVNHMAIGAGRVVYQSLVRINQAIKDGSFFKNKILLAVLDEVKKNKSTLHLKGLIGSGGVHSHQNHFYALLQMAKKAGLKKVVVHAFMDGRDTLPKSGLEYIEQLEDFLQKLGIGEIGSVCGRYWAMDRDKNWERTDKAFAMLTKGEGRKYKSAVAAVKDAYQRGETDEFIKPSIITPVGKKALIQANDGVIFVNFRNDRSRQLTERFLSQGSKNLIYATMTEYHPDYKVKVIFPQFKVANSLGEVISKAGLKQLRVTETEKFAHLTFFMNCKAERPFEGEDRLMYDTYSDVATHDQRPEMRTPDISQGIIQAMKIGNHQVIISNLCNGDMVGHTGNIKATIKGVETIDQALGEIVPLAQKKGYQVIITADHGNAEEMLTEEGEMLTAHTTNPVPFILISKRFKKLKKQEGSLIDVAPTVLKLLGLKQPLEMTGKSLV
jgi:2,3-bisphosphoglycerate-independent phosphoglycerate mutase